MGMQAASQQPTSQPAGPPLTHPPWLCSLSVSPAQAFKEDKDPRSPIGEVIRVDATTDAEALRERVRAEIDRLTKTLPNTCNDDLPRVKPTPAAETTKPAEAAGGVAKKEL